MQGIDDTANEASLVGQLLFGKLRVDSVLGRGGMGTVYRVTHLGTHHQRALKVMNPHIRMNEEALTRFLREATVSGTLKSPHVVETLDSGQLPDGSYYVLMELLDGMPLSDLIEQRGPMKLPRIARLLRQACSALALAHAQGIVHRDIKPDNLFVTTDPSGEESVKILDFGIARFRQKADVLGQVTAENAILGTPLYMAPEQIGNANLADGRADVYALGVVLYEALSGRKPYTAESFAELVAHIFDGTSTPLERTAPGLTPRAYEVVHKAMARKADDRFPNVGELGEALRELEQPFRPPPDPLAKTAASVIPPAAKSVVAVPTPGSSASIPETGVSSAAPPRGGPLPWVIAGLSALGLAAFAGNYLFGERVLGERVVAERVVVALPDVGTSAGVAGPTMQPDAGRDDAGVDAPSDAGSDAGATESPGRVPGGRRRDAGRRAAPGGLAGEEEIYGGH